MIYLPALAPQQLVRLAAAPSNMGPGNLAQTWAELILANVNDTLSIPLGGAVLAHQLAGTTLGHPESLAQDRDGPATAFRAQKFPVAPQGAPRGATSSYGFAGPAA